MTARLAAVGAAALVLAAPAGGYTPRKLHGNNFFSNCRFSHTAPDDPIVSPGHPGYSHPHTFFGNTSTNAASTLSSLRRGGTTCRPAADKAAYWVPTLYQSGREVRPSKAQVYYVLRGYDQMRAFPAGLKMIAGDAAARRPQSERIVHWDCAGAAVTSEPSARVPATCPDLTATVLGAPKGGQPVRMRYRTKSYLQLRVNFPDCWDGKHLDSPDHTSHMAYSRNYVCPASHPVKVPLIQLMIRYPIRTGAGVALASGGQLSGHADFFNAWDERALEKLVDDCFHDRPCNDPRRS